MVTPAVELAATALEDEAVDDVTVVALTGAGGPRTAISAANASLKPSPLRPAAGALAGSFGSAGLAVVTWAEAASMAPMKRVVGKSGRLLRLDIRPPQATLAPLPNIVYKYLKNIEYRPDER